MKEVFKHSVLFCYCCCFVVSSLIPFPLLAKNTNTSFVILYPDSSSKIQQIYKNIIKGAKIAQPDGVGKEFKVTNTNKNKIKEWVENNKPTSIIAIGNEVLPFAHTIMKESKLVATGILINQTNFNQAGVSISLQEKKIKNILQKYLPYIKKIYRVETGKNLIYSANNKKPPFFINKEITDDAEIVKFLWDKINSIDPKKEAVWVDSTIKPEYLSYLSERAWEKNVVLLSNNTSHLEIGVLLAFYPDFEGMGKRVGELLSLTPIPRLLEPLTAIKYGVNTRTARNLGVAKNFPEDDFSVVIK